MEKSVVLKDVVLQFLAVKPNEYKDNICYFKVNKGHKKDFTRLSKIEKCKLPFWCNEKGEYILKVKQKHVDDDIELVKMRVHVCNIILTSYEMEGEVKIFGYYASSLELTSDKA